MIRKITLLTICVFSLLIIDAQDFEWAINLDSPKDSYILDVVTDGQSNSIILGLIADSADIDSGNDTNYIKPIQSGYSHFVSKLDANGNVLWTSFIRNKLAEYSGELSSHMDENGNIYGFIPFKDTITIYTDSTKLNYKTNGNWDICLFSLTSEGVPRWSKHIGGKQADIGMHIDVDSINQICYLAGNFRDTVSFDSTQLVSTKNQFNLFSQDAFLASYDTSGNEIQVKTWGNPYSIVVTDIAIGKTGIYLAGPFSGSLDFNPGSGVSFGNFTGPSSFSKTYITKLDHQGNYEWTLISARNGSFLDIQISSDLDDNLYISMDHMDSLMIGDSLFSFGNKFYNSTLKLDNQRNIIWSNSFECDDRTHVKSLSVTTSGIVYLAGIFLGNAQIITAVDTVSLSSKLWFYPDCIIAKLDGLGRFVSAESFGSAIYYNSAQLRKIEADNLGNLYYCGAMKGPEDFDTGPDTFMLESSYGKFYGFLVKRSCSPTHFYDSVSVCDKYLWTDGITYDSSTHLQLGLTNSAGCDSILHLKLCILGPEVKIDGDSLVCVGESSFLNVSGAESYLWNTGETDSIIEVQPLDSTLYIVTGTSKGCSSTQEFLIAVEPCNSIPKSVEANPIVPYPNPANRMCTISFKENLSVINNIEVYNSQGKLTKSKVNFTSQKSAQILFPEENGIYIIKIYLQGELEAKFIKVLTF